MSKNPFFLLFPNFFLTDSICLKQDLLLSQIQLTLCPVKKLSDSILDPFFIALVPFFLLLDNDFVLTDNINCQIKFLSCYQTDLTLLLPRINGAN